jgi:hypothetical protein
MLGQHTRVEPAGQPAQLLQSSRELVLGAGHPVPRSRTGGRPPAAAQRVGQLPEPPLRPLVQAMLQPPAFLVACRQDPSTRRRELHDPGLHLGPEPGVGGRELGRGRHRVQQPRVLQHRRVVDQGGDRLALALHSGHRAPRTGRR